MSTVFSSTLWATHKKTLNKILDDPHDGIEAELIHPKWMQQRTMEDAYEDDMELGGPGLAAEKLEGQEMASGVMRQGQIWRYWAKTFGLKMEITDEAAEDNKYPDHIKLAKRNKRALFRTQDYEATLMLARAFSASFPLGNGQPLCSNSQPTPWGDVFANQSGAPASPSVAAVILAESAVRKYPGYDSTTEGQTLKKVVFPVEQWAAWAIILGSSFTPTANNFTEINVVNRKLDIEPVQNKFWQNTSTNYLFITDAEDGPQFRKRRAPRSSTWVENSQTVAAYAITARWATGTSNPRAVFGVAA